MSGSFKITVTDAVQYKCIYSYEYGSSTKFNYSKTGKDPDRYVLQLEKLQIVDGVAYLSVDIVYRQPTS